MELSREDIEHIAYLVRIEITDKEKNNFSGQLSEILNYVSQLESVDTNNVLETASVSGSSNVFREDKVILQDITPKELMSNAPELFDDYFKVKTVLE
ncbi:MAG: Asp-tRNA(Asn)/Glu-tRNA(Gln) amidotransferase subunit GatC [bacterium]|nr:Asp-tRNA(Asn)/Glu-tRNA(Gln) amidotransferase subunit GatC [bacterium]